MDSATTSSMACNENHVTDFKKDNGLDNNESHGGILNVNEIAEFEGVCQMPQNEKEKPTF